MFHVKHFASCSPKSHKALCLAEYCNRPETPVSSFQVAGFRRLPRKGFHVKQNRLEGDGWGGITTAAKSVGRAGESADSVITLTRAARCWDATYTGPRAKRMNGGSFTVPTGFTSNMLAQDVVIGMSALNWGYTVQCVGCDSYRDNEPIPPTSSLAISTPANSCLICANGYKAMPNGLCTVPSCPFSLAGGAR